MSLPILRIVLITMIFGFFIEVTPGSVLVLIYLVIKEYVNQSNVTKEESPEEFNDESDIAEFYNTLSEAEHHTLMENLLVFDQKEKLNYDCDLVKTVQKDMESMMEGMFQHVKGNLPWWISLHGLTLVKCGSFYHDMKIGQPNEFDFAIKLQKSLYLRIYEFFKSLCSRKQSWNTVDVYIFRSIRGLCEAYMRKICLPEEWKHGGISSPNFAGYRMNGSLAVMYQFVYESPGADPLPITVDIIVAEEKCKPWKTPWWSKWQEICSTLNSNIWKLMYQPPRFYSTSSSGMEPHPLNVYQYLESQPSPGYMAWLQQFTPDHPVKTCVRILKALNASGVFTQEDNEAVKSDRSHFEDRIRAEMNAKDDISKFQSFTTKELLIWMPAGSLKSHGEIYPSMQYLTSHDLQVLVLILYEACKSIKPPHSVVWTRHDVPKVILTTLDILHAYFSVKFHGRSVRMFLELGETSMETELNKYPHNKDESHRSRIIEHVESMLERVLNMVGSESKIENPTTRIRMFPPTFTKRPWSGKILKYNCDLLR